MSLTHCDACCNKFRSHQTVHLYIALLEDPNHHSISGHLKELSNVCDECDRALEYSSLLKSHILHNVLPASLSLSANDRNYISDLEPDTDSLYCSLCEEDIWGEESILFILKRSIIWKKRLRNGKRLESRDILETEKVMIACSSCLDTVNSYFASIRAASTINSAVNDHQKTSNE